MKRLGLHLSDDRVEQIVRAFTHMPPEIAEDMDREGITINARLSYLQLAKSKEDAAAELWDAVKTSGRSRLLSSAAKEMQTHPEITAEEALSLSETRIDDANLARGEAARSRQASQKAIRDGSTPDGGDSEDSVSRDPREAEEVAGPPVVNQEIAKNAINSLSGLLTELRSGSVLGKYEEGSLRLYVEEIRTILGD